MTKDDTCRSEKVAKYKIFISYKRNVEPDEPLALYLYRFLKEQGHSVFIDQTIKIGVEWSREIQTQIETSDFLVVLLSKASADSEMVVEEVEYAQWYKKKLGRPRILPVRVTYTDRLPYRLGAYLDPLHYALWRSELDNEPLAQAILEATNSAAPLPQEPIEFPGVGAGATVSEDGRVVSDEEAMPPPLPEFDRRFIEGLEAPEGAVRLRSRFYIERGADRILKATILESGTTTCVKGARQTGKSSLLARAQRHARENNRAVVYIDFQLVDRAYYQDLDTLLRHLANLIAFELKATESPNGSWTSRLGPMGNLTNFLSGCILTSATSPIVILLDRVDRLFGSPCRDEFFSLIRAWHEKRAHDELWDKLNLVLAYSTETHLFISDPHRSPFNVGLSLEMADFNIRQVRELNERHGRPITSGADLKKLVELVGGHPYLLRKAFYELVTQSWTTDRLLSVALTEVGPFGDHLRAYLWRFEDDPDLRKAMREVLREHACSSPMLFFRLHSSGLVKVDDLGHVLPRCGLYERYFKKHL